MYDVREFLKVLDRAKSFPISLRRRRVSEKNDNARLQWRLWFREDVPLKLTGGYVENIEKNIFQK